MADPTPDDVAKIDQNMALARHYLRSQTTAYAALVELAGSELEAQERLLTALGREQPDTLAKLLAVAIADQQAQANRWAAAEGLLQSWAARADVARKRADQDDLWCPHASRADVYEICVKGMRSVMDGL